MGVPELCEKRPRHQSGAVSDSCDRHRRHNGTHRKYFKDDEKYEKFYEMLCDLMLITGEPAGYYLQSLLVQWLRDNVDD